MGDSKANDDCSVKQILTDDLVETVSTHFPAPLAEPLLRLAAELETLEPSWQRAFLRLIDCFEISVTFAGLVSTAC